MKLGEFINQLNEASKGQVDPYILVEVEIDGEIYTKDIKEVKGEHPKVLTIFVEE